MVQYRDLNAPPSRMLADIVADMRAEARQSKTGDAGVKDLGETGDITWPGQAGGMKSVRRFEVDLDDTTALAAQLQADLDASLTRITGAEQNLTTLRDETLPNLRAVLEQADMDAAEHLGALESRIGTAEGAITAAETDLAQLRGLLDNTDLNELEQDLAAALAALQEFQDVTMPALDQRLAEAEQALTDLAETEVGDLIARLAAAETSLAEVRDETLPGLESRLDTRITSTAGALADQLAGTDQAVAGALTGLDQTLALLNAQDARITDQAAQLGVVGLQVQRGPIPAKGSPVGAQWLTPAGHLYVRIPCEEAG